MVLVIWSILDIWLGNPLLVAGTVFLFFFLDVKLTRLAFRLSRQEYAKYVKTQIYELNPMHQKEIHHGKPLKQRTWLLMGFLLIASVFLSLLHEPGDLITEIIFGFLFWTYFWVITTHTKNILQFRNLNKHPGLMVGEITITPTYTFKISENEAVIRVLLLIIVFLLVSDPFILGGVVGGLIHHFRLRSWHSRTVGKTQGTPCPSCKRPLDIGTNFCPFCGARLE